MALVSIVLAGCGSYTCSCPADGCDTCSSGDAKVAAPLDAGTITVASADPPCTATLQDVGGIIRLKTGGAQACAIHVGLSSGVTEDGQVTLQRVSGPCGCALSTSVTWSTAP
jgi:hypothetical protein